MRHEDFMQLALAEAERAEAAGDVPVGAVLVHAGQVVAVGHNTREARLDPTGHAELEALRAGAAALGRWRLTGCTLYVTLEPCPMCAAALVQCRVDQLVFGAQDPKQGAAGSLYNIVEDARLNHRLAVVAGVLEGACETQLKRYFAERR
jgi:tRNA(Arg) A34 adenosine deaminase TadA